MQRIRLTNAEWQFDEAARLGPSGGFGEVFRGNGDSRAVAVKRLKISAGAASHREMSIGSALAERTHSHVVPVLDYGQDAEGDRYYLVMPICECSLQDAIKASGAMQIDGAIAVAKNILAGLIEVRDIVHRDLKPGNVLRHENTWKIADFGIAKFVEDATSLESLRSSLTPPYAAPEQWRGERPTNATDVYALGCILYALLTGKPPFVGDVDSVREAHLHSTPPTLADIEPRLAGLVSNMLRKAPASRPSLERCQSVLSQIDAPSSSNARAALAAAGRVVSEAEATAEAARQANETAERQRSELAAEAAAELDAIIRRLFDAIEETTDSARRTQRAIVLGPAHLSLQQTAKFALNRAELRAGESPHGPRWDVVANSYLHLRADLGGSTLHHPGVYTFPVTLVYASTPSDSDYRWRELSFMEVWSNKPMHEQPIALNPLGNEFSVALSNVVGKHQLAYGPFVIDAENEPDFQERWLHLFARAATGRLQPPNQLPLPESFWAA